MLVRVWYGMVFYGRREGTENEMGEQEERDMGEGNGKYIWKRKTE